MISIILGHCEVAFPYISDTGTHTPESCLFSQLLNIASFLVAITIKVRYKQLEQQCRDNLTPDANGILTLNKASLWLGLLAAFGLSIVANFQELQLFVIHMIGAYCSVGLGLIYCCIQTRLSYYMMHLIKSGLMLARIRLALTVLLAINFTVSTILGPIALSQFDGTDLTMWKSTDRGYVLHLISAICEWISALSLSFYILTYSHEFKYMSISSPRFYMISTVSQSQNGGADNESDDTSYGVVTVIPQTDESSG